MRIPNKVVCLWSCLAAFTIIHTAVAQDYPGQPLTGAAYVGDLNLDDGTQDGYDAGLEYSPMAYQDGAAGVYDAPAQVPMGYPPPMVPPDTSYWPQVSPYETPVMERNYRQNGLWVNDSIYGNRTYSFGLEYMRVGFNRPGTDTIGDPKVIIPSNLSGIHPYNAGVFASGNDLLSDGLRARFLMENADKSSLELSGFWVGESSAVFQPYGVGDPNRPSTFRVRGILPLADGGTGTTVPYDTDFKLGYKEQAFGADLTFATAPMFESKGFRLRPVFGLKYLKIREEFSFNGQYSGYNYFFNPITGLPIPGTPFDRLADPYDSSLLSRVKSNLGGPEIGLRYELGGQSFLLTGQSKFAVLANGEAIELSGNRLDRNFFGGGVTPTPTDPKPAAFYNTQSNTHVSPTFTQDFQFKGKVFRALPFFNDIAFFANADMLVGYNFILVGNVARPTKIIDWNVDNPKIDVSHSRWYMQAVTWGMQWQF